MAITRDQDVVSDTVLGWCHERAPLYDGESRFFAEGFAALHRPGGENGARDQP